MAHSNPHLYDFFLKLIDEGKLAVTRDGKAFNQITRREIGKVKNPDSYCKVGWKVQGVVRSVQLHRLIWLRFNGPIQDHTLEVNHKDGNKQNNRLENLELCTSGENQSHAYQVLHKPILRGENRPLAKFTDKEVLDYRIMYSRGDITVLQLSREKHCSEIVAREMLTGKSYKHLPKPNK